MPQKGKNQDAGCGCLILVAIIIGIAALVDHGSSGTSATPTSASTIQVATSAPAAVPVAPSAPAPLPAAETTSVPAPVATSAAAPSSAPVQGGGSSGASCTATASVYYAPRDWNNVYVHSNQPYTNATASADGYSFGYETDGSGYALIYLNGPPPGAQITVTVGGATCTTSD